jgi:hypothetical protein
LRRSFQRRNDLYVGRKHSMSKLFIWCSHPLLMTQIGRHCVPILLSVLHRTDRKRLDVAGT